MTLLGWIRSKMFGASAVDRSVAAIMNEVEKEKSKLNGARVALSNEVDAIRALHKRGSAISDVLDDALRALNKTQTK